MKWQKTARGAAVVAVAVATVFGFTACSSNSGDTSSSSSGRVTVTFWDQKGGGASTTLDQLVTQFNNSQTKVTVQRQFIAGSATQFSSQIQNALRTNSAPNFVFGYNNPAGMGDLIPSGQIMDMAKFFGTGDYPVAKSDIFPGMVAESTFDNTMYSIPTDGGDYALFYNKQTFAAAGLTPPQTWADVTADAAKLTTGGKYGIYLPIDPGEWTTFTWLSMLWSAGGQFLSSDDKQAEFDSPAGIQALHAWTDLINSGHAYPSSLSDDSQQTGSPGFTAGQVAMFIGRLADLAPLDQAMGKDVVGVTALPGINKPAMCTGTNVSFIIHHTDAQDAAAWAFISWIMQPDNQTAWDKGSGYLPTSTKTEQSDAWKTYVQADPRIGVFADQLTYAQTRPSISQYSAVSTALAGNIEKAMLKQMSPEDALAAAAKTSNTALSQNS
ncbi:MAG: ABC transporter substrate-binding protein [Propionibacteriaceae bacterium]|nr:ABC transporter substrate-binding protein [Propionibacteriaceae bacterium]